MEAKVVRARCIGCGTCASMCSQVFDSDQDGVAIVISSPVPSDQEIRVQEVADGCPVEAIMID